MDTKLRLSAIKQSVKEYAESKDRMVFGAELALNTSEWQTLRTCAEKLIAIENMFAVLNTEANQLQELIRVEGEKEILEAIS